MKCSCNAGYCGENDDVLGYSDRELNAAREHICPECKSVIKKGDKFIFSSIFGIDDICNFKMCLNCWELTQVFFKDGWTVNSMMYELKDYLYDNWSEDLPSDCISSLNPVNKAMICDILQQFQEE